MLLKSLVVRLGRHLLRLLGLCLLGQFPEDEYGGAKWYCRQEDSACDTGVPEDNRDDSSDERGHGEDESKDLASLLCGYLCFEVPLLASNAMLCLLDKEVEQHLRSIGVDTRVFVDEVCRRKR